MLRVRAARAPPRTRGGGPRCAPSAPSFGRGRRRRALRSVNQGAASALPAAPGPRPRGPGPPGAALRRCGTGPKALPTVASARRPPPHPEREPAASGVPAAARLPPGAPPPADGGAEHPAGRPQSFPPPGTPAGRAPGPPFPPRSPLAPRPLSGLATCRGARAQEAPLCSAFPPPDFWPAALAGAVGGGRRHSPGAGSSSRWGPRRPRPLPRSAARPPRLMNDL